MNKVRSLINAVLPYAIRPVWWIVRVVRLLRKLRSKTRSKRVLLICHNVVAAEHQAPIAELLMRDGGYRVYVANDHFPAQEITKREIKRKVRVKYLPVLACLVMDWDLVIYVNHAWGWGAWFAPFLQKIYINHGLYAGKINNALGEDGVYGRHRTTRPHRGLLYDRMFAASSFEKEMAVRADPALANVVRVTGSLMADRVVSHVQQRAAIRSRLGFKAQDCVIHVISTWGTASLMATVGAQLLEHLDRAGHSHRVLLSLHPRWDKFGRGSYPARRKILQYWSAKGAVVDEDNSAWRDFLVASDVTIADHSSLALYHVLLDHPLIVIPVPPDEYVAESTFELVSGCATLINDVSELPALLNGAAMRSDRDEGLLDRLVEHRGSSGARHLEEIRSLLQ